MNKSNAEALEIALEEALIAFDQDRSRANAETVKVIAETIDISDKSKKENKEFIADMVKTATTTVIGLASLIAAYNLEKDGAILSKLANFVIFRKR